MTDDGGPAASGRPLIQRFSHGLALHGGSNVV